MTNDKILKIIKTLSIGLSIIALILVGFIWYAMQPKKMGGDFSANFRGNEWSFKDNAKPLNLLYIGYMRCPDVCPMTMSVVSRAFKGLSDEEKNKVNFIFLSVDYEHDTAEGVADYASGFNPNFVGLSGTKKQIYQTINTFGASFIVEKDANTHMGYSITHTDRLYFLDNEGIVITNILNPDASQDVLKTIKDNL